MIRARFVTVLLVATAGFAVSAEDTSVEPAVPELALDDLLSLPTGYRAEVERRAGGTATEWRERFTEARKTLEDAKLALAKTETELDQVAQGSSAWQVSAPGSSDPQVSPLSLRLREQVRGYREAIKFGVRALRVLTVEADLASVPSGWRE
jgi:hypothetical protein